METTTLKLQWDYTHEEIKSFIATIIEKFKSKKVLNKIDDEADYEYLHKYSFEIPFSINDGSYTHNLEMLEWEEGKKKKKALYGLYIKSIEKDGHGPGKDWTCVQPVVKFYKLEDFL